MIDPENGVIHWKLHLRSSPEHVYRMLSTGSGRRKFWAERAEKVDGLIHFQFPNGQTWDGVVLSENPPHHYQVEYYDGSRTNFYLQADGEAGTDLTLIDEGVPEKHQAEVNAGWVSVLMTMKAAMDYSVDLRNHDPSRSWDQGYVEN